MAETPIPRALQKQLDRGQQLVAQQTRPPADGQGDAAPGTQNTAQPPQQEPQRQAQSPASQTPPASPTPPAQPRPQDTDWKHRFDTVNGILRAERERHQREKADLEARIEALQRAQQARLQAPEHQSSASVSLSDASVTQMLRDNDHDPEIVDAFEALERQNVTLQQQLQQALEANREMAEQVQNVQVDFGRARADVYLQQLEDALPDRLEIEADPDFALYMQEVDPHLAETTGDYRTRQELLIAAHTAQDARRVIRFYESFKQARSARQPQGQQPKTPPIDPAPSVGAGDGPPQGETYTLAQYNDLMNQISKGRIKGQQAERLYAALDQAAREGRITGMPRRSGGVMNPSDFGTLPG